MNRPVWCECCRVQCNNYRHYQQHIRGRRHLIQERQHAIDVMNNEIQQARQQADVPESGQLPSIIPQTGLREWTRLVHGAGGNSDEREIEQSSSALSQPTQHNRDRNVIDVDAIAEIGNNHALPTRNDNITSRIEDDIEPLTFEELCQKKVEYFTWRNLTTNRPKVLILIISTTHASVQYVKMTFVGKLIYWNVDMFCAALAPIKCEKLHSSSAGTLNNNSILEPFHAHCAERM